MNREFDSHKTPLNILPIKWVLMGFKTLHPLKIRFRHIFYTIGFLLFLSCNTPQSQVIDSEGVELIKYAKLLSIRETKDSFFVRVYTHKESFKQYSFGKNGRSSFSKIVSLSSVFSGFICEIQAHDKIVGVDNIAYISNPILLEREKSKKVHSVSLGGSLNIEEVIKIKPDLVIHSGFGEVNDVIFNKLNQYGISFFLCNNYLEEDPLGRAEWIKVFGIICGRKEVAFEKFNQIEKEYLRLKKHTFKKQPTVLVGSIFGGVWDVPGGNSYVAKLIQDAGGDYLWKNHKQSGRLPLSIESVAKIGLKADVWINPGAHVSLDNMSSIEPRYKQFKAFQHQKVFNNNRLVNSSGGNEFWETGPVRPDLVLRDLIRILHPEIKNNKELHYYQSLK